jgi:Kef-type K+ transport system membrane component KefB
MHAVFTEFSIVLAVAAIAGAVGLYLRQPLIISFILIGILAGPSVLGFVSVQSQIDLLAQVGVTVLLFLVGLKLDFQQVRSVGPVALATGLGQLGFTIGFGFLLTIFLGRPWLEGLYIAIALTFSSTIIIVKLLSDKRELESLHGRIAVGFLIVQDLAVVIAMMFMSTLKAQDINDDLASLLLSVLLRLALAAALLFVLIRWVLDWLTRIMARSQELLLIFAIAWGTGLAAVGEGAGFSMEAGAFLAGFSLASSHYRDAISARLTGIRDFLLLFFFIDLGSRLDLSTMGEDLLPAFILSTFVLVGNPLIVMAIMGAMGYRKRTGFLAGLTVAQISEFSIIFIAMGIGIGHISNNTLGLVTMVGLLTIALSVYMILYAGPLFEKLSPWLSFFERKQPYREMNAETMLDDADSPPDVIVIGLGRYGGQLAAQLKTAGLDVLGLDLDPEAAQDSRGLGIRVKFGDAIDAELIATLPLHSQGWIVSTLPDFDSNRTLLRLLRESQYGGELVFVARDDASGMALKGIGASIVLYTLRDAVNRATEVLTKLVLERRST